jgi:hypothetical protein
LQDEQAEPVQVELFSHGIVKPKPETHSKPEPKSVSEQTISAEQENNNAAPQQNEITNESSLRVAKRNHGGALPQ